MTSSSRHYTILAAILLAALALRVVAVSSQGLWFDEGLSIVIARWSASDMLLLPTDPTPALYYLLHKAFIPPDASLLWIRSISIVCGVISVGLMYVLARLSFGRLAGLIAAALLAVWTAHVDYSQEARCYSLLIMLTLLASVGVMTYGRAETRSGRLWGLLLLAAGDVLGFYTHLTAVYWIVATSLLVLGFAVRRRRPLWEIAVAFAAMAVLAAPGVYRLWRQTKTGNTFNWLAQADLQVFASTLSRVLLPVGFWENPWIGGAAPWVHGVVAALSLALLAAALWRWGTRVGTSLAAPLIVAYLAMPFALWVTGFFVLPIYMPRTVLFVIPGFALLIAGLCSMASAAVFVSALVVSAYLASTLLFGLMREKQDFRGAARFLEASAKPGDVIATCPVDVYPALRYHAQGLTGSMVMGATYQGALVRLEGPLGSDRAWDQHYFSTQLVPRFKTSGAGPPPVDLPLPAGRAIWRVNAFCGQKAKTVLDGALAQIAGPGLQVWIQRGETDDGPVTVWRYVVKSSATWRLLQRAERPAPHHVR